MRFFSAAIAACTLYTTASPGMAQQSPRLGTLDFPTSGSGRAQREFVTGVLYLHSFEYESAAAAFRRAQAIDPAFAMAYWGEAMTDTHPVWNQQDTAAGRAALRRLGATPADRAARAGSARERQYLAAVEALYGNGTKPARDTAYALAMARLATANPHDAEAQAFYALALLGLSQGARDIPTYMRAGAIAESLFAALPNHPGAAHYVIHAFDDPTHAPLGLRAARAYSVIAPDAAHAQHMTSHIFLALGMWDETAHANEIATVATRDSLGPWPRWSCGHYGEWLQYAYPQQGRPAAAQQLLDECRQQAAAAANGRRRTSLAVMRAAQIVDGGDGAGATVHASDAVPGDSPTARAYFAFGTGYAAARCGDTTAARTALRAMSTRTRIGSADADAYADICALELEALLRLQSPMPEESVMVLRRAVAIEDSLPVDFGPPIDIKPPRELLGEALVRLGQPGEAQAELQRQLARTPRRAATLAALASAARAAGNAALASATTADLANVRHAAEQRRR